MLGHTLPCQTRTGISGWSCERRQDLLSRFEVFSSRQEVSSFKNCRESHLPHWCYTYAANKSTPSEGHCWAAFSLTALLSACPLACPCRLCLSLNGIRTPQTSACGLKGSIPWCGEQRKSWEPETNLIIVLFPGHIIGIISVFSSLPPKRANTSQRMQIKEKQDCTQALVEAIFTSGLKKMKGPWICHFLPCCNSSERKIILHGQKRGRKPGKNSCYLCTYEWNVHSNPRDIPQGQRAQRVSWGPMRQTINAKILDHPLYWKPVTLQSGDALWWPCHGVYDSQSGLAALWESSLQAPGNLWSCIGALSTGSGALTLFQPIAPSRKARW